MQQNRKIAKGINYITIILELKCDVIAGYNNTQIGELAVNISQCGAWREKIPDLGEESGFDPRDNFVVLIEEL